MRFIYYKEWVMRIILLFLVGVLALFGCQSYQERNEFPEMVTEEISIPKPLTFIEALRRSCEKYGMFTLDYQGETEHYRCERI